jgi:hypothetical protein
MAYILIIKIVWEFNISGENQQYYVLLLEG